MLSESALGSLLRCLRLHFGSALPEGIQLQTHEFVFNWSLEPRASIGRDNRKGQ